MDDARVPIDAPSLSGRIGELVREARRVIGWTQAELALRVGTSQSRISR
jgi:ribosome-binding protein aMBF1 (putative translation factor)